MEQIARKVISFAGTKRGDIVYYTTKALASCNEPVLVIDNSRQHDLFGSICVPDNKIRDITVRNITYVKDADFSANVMNDFRYIVIYHGTRISQQWWNNSDIRFIMTNFDRFDVEEIGNAFRMANIDPSGAIPVFFDRRSSKIKDLTILQTIGIDKKDAKTDVFLELEPDESSAANWIAFQYNGSQKLSKLSKQMQKVIYGLYSAIVNKNERMTMAKMIKSAD